jgi:hypothetical protein
VSLPPRPKAKRDKDAPGQTRRAAGTASIKVGRMGVQKFEIQRQPVKGISCGRNEPIEQ